MNVGPTGSGISVLQPSTTNAVGAVAPSVDPDGDGDGGRVGAAASTSISSAGSVFGQLKSLEESDPSKFKQVMSDMAASLRTDAQQTSGEDAQRLNAMADRLDKASQSGQLSDAAPQAAGHAHRGHHHGHHHGGHGGASGIGAQLQSAFESALSSLGQDATSTTDASTTTSTSAGTTASTITSTG